MMFSRDAYDLAIKVLQKYFPDDDAPGFAFAMYDRGEAEWWMCRGVASLESGEPIGFDSNFRLASVTKQFTAAATLLLVQDGRLSRDLPVRTVLPELSPGMDPVRLDHLLHHTSGLPDYEEMVSDESEEQVVDADILRLISQVESLDFPAGSRFRYSNTGYAFLSLIIERVAGISFPDFLKTRIFDPAGMEDTLVYVQGGDRPAVSRRIYGYRSTDDGYEPCDQTSTSAVLGDGGVYSSLRDYGKWLKALDGNTILNKDTRSRLFQPGRLENGDDVPYGFGWRLEPLEGKPGVYIPYHPGLSAGFSHCVRLRADGRSAMLLLTNARSSHPASLVLKEIDDLVR